MTKTETSVCDVAPPMEPLARFLGRVPGVRVLASSDSETDPWWVKIKIDTRSPLAWNVVQEFGHVLNSISVSERLPVLFYPVSPPPCMNSGPATYLTWMIEARQAGVAVIDIAAFLEGRLPKPVEDAEQWGSDDE